MKKCLICNNEATRDDVCTDCHIVADGRSYGISQNYQKAEITSFSRRFNFYYVNSDSSIADIKRFLIDTYAIVLLARRNNDEVVEKKYLERLISKKKEYEDKYFSPRNKLRALIDTMNETSAGEALLCLSFYQDLYKNKMRATSTNKERLRELVLQSSDTSIASETEKLKARFPALCEQIEFSFVIR